MRPAQSEPQSNVRHLTRLSVSGGFSTSKTFCPRSPSDGRELRPPRRRRFSQLVHAPRTAAPASPTAQAVETCPFLAPCSDPASPPTTPHSSEDASHVENARASSLHR